MKVAGERVYHARISLEEYTGHLHALGMEVLDFVPEDLSADYASVLLAQNRA